MKPIGIAAATLILAASLALLFLNTVMLDQAIPVIETRIKETIGIPATIEAIRYFPGRGVTIRGIATSDPGESDAARITIALETMRFRLTRRLIAAIRSSTLPSISPPDLSRPVSWLCDSIEQFAEAGWLPDTVHANRAAVYSGATVVADLGLIRLAHDPKRSRLTVSTMDSDETTRQTVSMALDLDYRTASGRGAIAWSDLSLPHGRRVSNGSVSAKIDVLIDPSSPETVGLTGMLAAEGLAVAVPSLAVDPVEDLDFECEFDLVYRARSKIAPDEIESSRSAVPSEATLAYPPPILERRLGNTVEPGTASSRTDRTGSIEMRTLSLLTGGVSVDGSGVVAGLFGPGETSISTPAYLELTMHMPRTALASVVDAVPEQIGGSLTKMIIDGSVEADFGLHLPFGDLDRIKWALALAAPDLIVRAMPEAVNVFKTNRRFVHLITDNGGFRRSVEIPPATPASLEWMLTHSEHTRDWIEDTRRQAEAVAAMRPPVVETFQSSVDLTPDPNYRYVRLDELSPWVPRAVLTAEDGDFFFYEGVNPVTLTDAVIRNLAEQEIVLGASTITMQLVKMLFLDQTRVFSRKLKESFLVYLVERVVPVTKDRILELYLNLAEFGPGIYGIADAADHYFAADPAALTAGQAAWLASILPAPQTWYRYYEAGRISPEWFKRMVGLFDIMLERGRMNEAEYREAVKAPPEFNRTE